jgi:hypothetical protein
VRLAGGGTSTKNWHPFGVLALSEGIRATFLMNDEAARFVECHTMANAVPFRQFAKTAYFY